MKSPLYWHPFIYNLTMRFLYGKDFYKKYQIVAKETGLFSVLDVCCGDCSLADYVGYNRYYGIDINSVFITHGQKKGLRVSLLDVTKEDWPVAECVVMLSSLYQFIPDHEKILEKAFRAAQNKVIISEPIYNLADSKNRLIAWIARNSTSPGTESSRKRFNYSTLKKLYDKYNAVNIIDIGRELVGIFDINEK